jgi:hypothetical protein
LGRNHREVYAAKAGGKDVMLMGEANMLNAVLSNPMMKDITQFGITNNAVEDSFSNSIKRLPWEKVFTLYGQTSGKEVRSYMICYQRKYLPLYMSGAPLIKVCVSLAIKIFFLMQSGQS